MTDSEDSSFYSSLMIYAVMFGLMIGAYIYSKLKESTKWKRFEKARNDIDLIYKGIQGYYAHYKRLPITDNDSDKQNDDLLYILHGCKTEFGRIKPHMVNSFFMSEHNPDRINFLEPFGTSFPVDPWGNPYNIYIDRDGDCVIQMRHVSTRDLDFHLHEERTIKVGRPVAIWSNGPDRVNSWGEGDDIKSW